MVTLALLFRPSTTPLENSFLAGIHPRALASRLTRERAARLHRAIQDVLLESIETGGSSVSDYVDSEGRRGAFQLRHRVYGKEGKPCPACGSLIRRILVAQRETHFCPKCQKR
jgi:formamidopyrimidine-DNA glycosylase